MSRIIRQITSPPRQGLRLHITCKPESALLGGHAIQIEPIPLEQGHAIFLFHFVVKVVLSGHCVFISLGIEALFVFYSFCSKN